MGQRLEAPPRPPPQCRGLVWDYDKVGQCDSIQHSKPYQQGGQQCCLGECVDFCRPVGWKKPKSIYSDVFLCSSPRKLEVFFLFFFQTLCIVVSY